MRPFRDLSIRHKLTLIVLLTSAVAIVLGGVMSVVYERVRSHRELVANLSAEAEIIGANSAAALAFGDQKAAQEILSALRFRREIIYACLYDNDGNVFAEYRTAATRPGRATARAATHENYWLDDGDLLLCRPLRLGGDAVGSICLRADLRAVRALVAAYAGISLAVVGVLLALSWLISIRLRRTISDPILELADLTRRIGTNRDYSLRPAKRNADEIGVLTDGLNHMLDQIAEHERKLLDVREREQCRIGQDLHDMLGQHLTATTVAVDMLENELREQKLSQAPKAVRIGRLLREALAQTRDLARGLYPLGLKTEGLGFALASLASSISQASNVDCRVHCPQKVLLENMTVATHLYRIAQEAINNALKHGHATMIRIGLHTGPDGGTLTIEDNGTGIAPADPPSGGMGIEIMLNRSRLIGGRLAVCPRAEGGTIVRCTFPPLSLAEEAVEKGHGAPGGRALPTTYGA